MALVLVSKPGDSIRIGEIEITLSQVNFRRATLAIKAPESVEIVRSSREGNEKPAAEGKGRGRSS